MNTGLLSVAAMSLLPRPATYLKAALLKLAAARGIRIEFVDISGGPAAGKTELMLYIESEMRKYGWQVIIVPEAPTIIRNMGLRPEEGHISNTSAQMAMLLLSQHLRLQALAAAVDAEGVEKVLIVGDRSDLDAIPYLGTQAQFTDFLHSVGLNIADIIVGTHHVFLQSLAVDNPVLYEKVRADNPARKEDASAAAEANRRTLSAIRGFVNPEVIGNHYEGGFEGKLTAALNAIHRALNQAGVQRQLSYLIKLDRERAIDYLGMQGVQPIRIEQFYTAEGACYRMTEYPGGHRVFVLIKKTEQGTPGYRFAYTERVHPDVYHVAFVGRDRSISLIHKERFCQVSDGGTLITLDVYGGLLPSNMQRVELSGPTDLEIPWAEGGPDSPQVVEITGKPEYSNFGIGKGLGSPYDVFR